MAKAKNQNRTRLECKQKNDKLKIIKNEIRIEPDWNVNSSASQMSIKYSSIRIEPDWNVNSRYLAEVLKILKLEQNQIGM